MIAKQFYGPRQISQMLGRLPNIQPLPRDAATTTLPGKHRGAFWYAGPGYAGFTSAERERHYMLQLWMTTVGILPVPTHCSICASTARVNYHAENYYTLWSMPGLCWACHMALHKRGTQLHAWKFLVENHTVSGNEWFAAVPDDPNTDIAGYLRQQHGEDYRWVEKTSLQCLPAWVVPPPIPASRAKPAVPCTSDSTGETVQPVAPLPLTAEELTRPIRRKQVPMVMTEAVLRAIAAASATPMTVAEPLTPPPAMRLRTRLPARVNTG